MTIKDTSRDEKRTLAKAAPVKFKCKSCGKLKPVDEMNILDRFFPPLVVCDSCEKEMI